MKKLMKLVELAVTCQVPCGGVERPSTGPGSKWKAHHDRFLVAYNRLCHADLAKILNRSVGAIGARRSLLRDEVTIRRQLTSMLLAKADYENILGVDLLRRNSDVLCK